MSSAKPVVVIGDGWAALGAVGFLVSTGVQVRWIAGTGARMLAPLGSLEWSPGVGFWIELARKLGVDCGEPKHGIFVREFRNKAFRLPAWSQAPSLEARAEVRDEVLWAPEQNISGVLEARFSRTLGEIEEELRKKLTSENYSNLKKSEGVPVIGFKSENGELRSVTLGSGEDLSCEYAIYADRWSALHGMEGLPKPIGFLRNLESMGVLQICFSHRPSLPMGVMESFFTTLQRETQGKSKNKLSKEEELERHIWGHLSSDGTRSTWTLCLTTEEAEDNHEIAKRLRRLKTLLDKVFSVGGIIPAGQGTFGATVIDEQVRFEENAVFASGSPLKEPAVLPELAGISFLTDGFGPSQSLFQVGTALGIQIQNADAETKDVDSLNIHTV